MALVSVVIPVYGVEAYLSRCVDSVLAQTLEDIEIILVDDGSPDRCPQLCDQYAAVHPHIQVVHKENGGLASARNGGMAVARGKYLFFLDSDDWIDPNALQELVEVAEAEGVDFVRFRPMYAGWPGIADGTLCDFGTEEGMTQGLYSRQRMERELYPRLLGTRQLTLGPVVAAWRSLYRRAFLEEHGLRFDQQVRYCEDTVFSARVVRAAQSFYYLDGPCYYHYWYNGGSITKSFRADRWQAFQRLMDAFEHYFGEDVRFAPQLPLQKLYCVMSALSERRRISGVGARWKWCREICRDPRTRAAMAALGQVEGSWKLKLTLRLAALRWSALLAVL